MSELSDRDGNADPPPQTGGRVQDLHATSDIRFVMREVSTLTERIRNLVDRGKEDRQALKNYFDKVDTRFDKLDVKITGLNTKATYIQWFIGALTVVGAIVGFFFHDKLAGIADAVAKLGK